MITISKEDLSKLIENAVVKAVSEAIETGSLIKLAPSLETYKTKPRDDQWHIDCAIKNIAKAKKYSNHRLYGKVCSVGAMPHSLLLKQSGLSTDVFKKIMNIAVEQGKIKEVQLQMCRAKVYAIG